MQGRQPAGRTGVWVEDRKIAALGVQISAGIATHGTALNVATDLSHFKSIVPCGLPDSPVTSLNQETKKVVAIDEVSSHLLSSFIDVFAYEDVRRADCDRLQRHSTETDILNIIESAKPIEAS